MLNHHQLSGLDVTNEDITPNVCPQCRAANLIDEFEHFDDVLNPLTVKELEDTAQVLRDEGEEDLNCIVQKILLSPKQPLLSQRHAIFNTRCTVQQKVVML